MDQCLVTPVQEIQYGAWWLRNMAIQFILLCQCLSEETLKAAGPFFMVSMAGEGKYPTQRVKV